MISISVSQNINRLLNLDKQLVFAAAKTLTQIAKQGQTAAVKEIQKVLKPRTPWYLPQNALGVHIKMATRGDLSSEVKSSADFLAKLKRGETHVPSAGRSSVAVPTRAIRPTGREVIRAGQRPRSLIGKGAFIVTARTGQRLLVRRRGLRPGDLEVLYVLKPSTRRPKKDPMTRAVRQTVTQRFGPTFAQNFADAIKTAR